MTTKTTKPRTARARRATAVSDLEASLLRGMTEAVAHARGDLKGLRTTERPVTARQATAEPAPQYKATEIRKFRAALKLSQPVMAKALNVKVETLRAWEQGVTSPSGPSLRLLQWATQHPELVLSQVHSR